MSKSAVPAVVLSNVGPMGCPDDARDDTVRGYAHQPAEAAHDCHWAGEVRSAIRCSGALLVFLLLIDWGVGDVTPWRAALWAGLAALLFVVLFPPRVTAGAGWLASRGPLWERRVRTDQLVSIRCLDGVSQRLLLRDAFGGRVEIDPRVLIANPPLWHRVNEDVSISVTQGSLLCGATALRRLSERIDRETAATVFKVSGLESEPE